ncbi:MAG: hypothetical protein MZV63_21595 [Marinilabiliales bacterium]|nr:hypothetical protein [Marinilabiliales bacterium]
MRAPRRWNASSTAARSTVTAAGWSSTPAGHKSAAACAADRAPGGLPGKPSPPNTAPTQPDEILHLRQRPPAGTEFRRKRRPVFSPSALACPPTCRHA